MLTKAKVGESFKEEWVKDMNCSEEVQENQDKIFHDILVTNRGFAIFLITLL